MSAFSSSTSPSSSSSSSSSFSSFVVVLSALKRQARQPSFLVVVLSALYGEPPCPVFPAGPEPRPSALSVPCHTSTAIVCAQCSLPDLNRDHLRSVFPAGPQPRPSALRVPCRTSTATICAPCSLPSTATLCGQCSLPDLNCNLLRPLFPAGPQPRPSALSAPCRASTAR